MEHRDNKCRRAAAAELPQWNSRFRFSAQKAAADTMQDAGTKKDASAPGSRTPRLGMPRRVPTGKAAGKQEPAAKGAADTPLDSDKTPTVCLFQRFESLTLTTPAGSKTGTGTAAVADSAAAAATAAAAAEGRRARSVAFGTPSVLTYTPAPAGATPQQDGTPLWSNAGHTPYSMSGQGAAGGCIRAVCVEGADGGPAGFSSSSGVCMELFSSVIADTELQQTPVPTVRCPKTPGEAAAGAATAAAAKSAAVAAGVTAGGTAGDGEEGKGALDGDDMLLTPITVPHLAAASSSSFTGFGAGVQGAAAKDWDSSTPPFFTKAAAADAAGSGSCDGQTPAAAVAAASRGEAAAGAAAPLDGVGGHCLPELVTPRSKLRQPARVPLEGSKPTAPLELKQLLQDAEAVVAADQGSRPLLGSCDVLSPVRPKKQLQQALGAGEQVLSPVRRSARKATRHVMTEPALLKPMLEATHYCYQPNAAIPDHEQQP